MGESNEQLEYFFTIENSGGFFASQLKSLGDIDGDNRGDLLFSWMDNVSGLMNIRAVSGGRMGQELWTASASLRNEYLGRSLNGFNAPVSIFHDDPLDPDSVPDILVGVPRRQVPIAGSAQLLSSVDGSVLRTALAPTASPSFSAFSDTFVRIRDLDGDRVDEIAFMDGTWDSPATPWNPDGRVLIYSGSDFSPLHEVSFGKSFAPPGITILNMGILFGNLGDIDGDGADELLVWGNIKTGGLFGIESAYHVISSGNGSVLYSGCNSFEDYPDCNFNNQTPPGAGSISPIRDLEVVNDLNNDGVKDYVFSYYRRSGSEDGFLVAYSGAEGPERPGGPLWVRHWDHDEGTGDQFDGRSVDQVSDLNGDGADDLVLAIPSRSSTISFFPPQVRDPKLMYLSGATGERLFTSLLPEYEMFRNMTGSIPSNIFGQFASLEAIDDINGDGLKDVAIQSSAQLDDFENSYGPNVSFIYIFASPNACQPNQPSTFEPWMYPVVIDGC